MKNKFPSSPFAPLMLTEADRMQLQRLANDFVADVVDDYEQYLASDRQIDGQRWKFFKQRDDLKTYVEKKQRYPSFRRPRRDAVRPTVESTMQLTYSDLPLILSAGSSVGRLDDLLYGNMAASIQDMRINSVYIDDNRTVSVLAPVIEPKVDDPFTSLAVKWAQVDFPWNQTHLVRNRDFVFLEGTGVVLMRNGERVGYHLMHSINFPQTHRLPSRVRANVSVCGLFRQAHSHAIEVFGPCVVDMAGGVPKSVSIAVAVEVIFGSTKFTYCGQMKKLATAVKNSRRLGRLPQWRSNSASETSSSLCVTCAKEPLRGIYAALSLRQCRICHGIVCFGCKIKKRLCFVSVANQVVVKEITLCSKCIAEATSGSAVIAARGHLDAQFIENSAYSSTSSESRYTA